MLAESILITLFLVLFGRSVRKLAPKIRLLLWLVLSVHVLIIGLAHYWAVQQDATGVVIDTSVDAQKYYFSAQALAYYPLWSITAGDVTRVSGSVWHVGYYYLCVVAMKLSSHPMLLVRIFKVTLFFLALAFTARIWQGIYGVRATLFGVAYLGLGWWEIVYHNFRNYRDGLMVSVCLFLYALLLRQLHGMHGPGPITLRQHVARWSPVAVCLAALCVLRVYLAFAFAVGILVHVILEMRISLARRVVALMLVSAAALATIEVSRVYSVGLGLLDERMDILSLAARFYGVAKALLAPIPWQYSESFLIPSQFIYLGVLLCAVWCLISRVHPKPWWQMVIVFVLVLFLGLMLDTSRARKRMPVVPIIASWVVAGLGSKPRRQGTTKAPETRFGQLEPAFQDARHNGEKVQSSPSAWGL